MNGLIKQLFIPNCPVAQLVEHKTGFCNIFHKMNRYHDLMIIQLLPLMMSLHVNELFGM